MQPMNNPLLILAQAARSGGRPDQLLRAMAAQDPQVARVLQLLANKSPQQQRQIAETMARERGLSVDDIARQLGIQIPSDR